MIPEIVANAKPGASLSVVALHYAEVPVNFMLVLMKELQLVGAMAYPDDYTRSLELLAARDMSPMVTHHFALERFHDALEVAQDPSRGGKVMMAIG